jgi:hypothetical protein
MNVDQPPKRKFNIIRKLSESVPVRAPTITFVIEDLSTEDLSTEEPSTDDDLSDNMPALTRYLYIHTDVEHTLRTCFANPGSSTVDEVLFWTYELYFSGFIVEVIEILSSIYAQYFKKPSEKFRSVIADLIEDEDRYECIATITHNLFIRRKRQWLKPTKNWDPIVWVTCQKSGVARFRNKLVEKPGEIPGEIPCDKQGEIPCDKQCDKPSENLRDLTESMFLRTARKYNVAANPEQLYNKTVTAENWVYYAYYTPLWRKRIDLFSATMILDHDTETIRFRTNAFAVNFGLAV